MKITGYILIKKDAQFTGNSKLYNTYNLQGQIVPELENGGHEGTLIAVPNWAANIRITEAQIESRFACEEIGGFIYPPGLTEFEKTQYVSKLDKLSQPYDSYWPFIINDSLKAGKFTDTCLFNEIQAEK